MASTTRISNRSTYIILAICIAFIGFVLFQNWRQEAYRNSSEGRTEVARQEADSERFAVVHTGQLMVKMKLRDPYSAVFEGERVLKVDGKNVLCGTVNSRNGFGGMAGPALFAQVGVETHIVGQTPDAIERVGYYCGRS